MSKRKADDAILDDEQSELVEKKFKLAPAKERVLENKDLMGVVSSFLVSHEYRDLARSSKSLRGLLWNSETNWNRYKCKDCQKIAVTQPCWKCHLLQCWMCREFKQRRQLNRNRECKDCVYNHRSATKCYGCGEMCVSTVRPKWDGQSTAEFCDACYQTIMCVNCHNNRADCKHQPDLCNGCCTRC